MGIKKVALLLRCLSAKIITDGCFVYQRFLKPLLHMGAHVTALD